MSLRLIIGRAGSGKTRYCLNEIKNRVGGAAHPLVLLVPEQFTFQAERDLISVLETGGILKTEVLSFRRMAFRIFNNVGGITYPHIHSAGKSMIIYRILDKMRDSLRVFAKSADRQGFVSTLGALITEFKRYNITPEALEAAGKVLGEDSPLKDKLLELKVIYDSFEKTIAERYRDSDDDLTLASEKLDSSTLYDGAEIWIDGFSGFTPQEYRVIAGLMKKAGRINICLCTDSLEGEGISDGTDVFSAVKGAAGKLVKYAKESGIKIEKEVLLGEEPLFRFRNSPELAHLERNLYAYPYKTYREKTGDISLFSSVNIFSEIEAAARDIVRLCRDRGMRYRDLAVVVRNLADYERPIEVIFAEYGIPCFMDRKIDIANNPLVRLILSMLDIFNENWSYEAVFRYLKTGLTGIDRSGIDRLENYVLACGIRGSRWTGDQEWDMLPGLIPDHRDGDKYGALLEINRTRYEICGPLLEFRRKTRGRKKASEICGALYDFLLATGVPGRMEAGIERFRKSGQLSLANEYSQVWNTVMEVFDQTVEVMGEETLGLERFTNILKIGLGEYRLGLIPASLDQVLVGSVERSKSHAVKALYILGANDGVFPAAAAEEGILSDLDRKALLSAGIELASDTRTKAFDEQYLVYRALTTAESCLRLSWPMADHEGRTMRPSIMINRLRKLFPAITEASNILRPESDKDEVELVTGKTPAFKHLVAALRQKADGRDIRPLWQEVYRWFAAREEWRAKLQSVRSAFLIKNIAYPVGRDKIPVLYGDPAYASVSRLEKYTACPFAYYVQYGLGAGERKIYRLSPPDVGTFMHAVIERFSRQVADQNIDWRGFDREWCMERVSAIVDEMLEKMQGGGLSGSKRYTALTLRLKRVIARAVWIIAEHIRRGSFNPVGYEMDFGDGGAFPPITIELDSGERILLTGRIDRVDALTTGEGTYLRIIDYKSGSKAFKLSDVFYGLQVQLITYLDAIRENSGFSIAPPVLPGGVLYFKIDDPIIKGKGRIPEEEIEQAIMKQLKMKGLLLADVKLIREMDHTMEGTSLIIPARINKGDMLGKSSAATPEQFSLLRKYVRRLLKGLGEEIMKGNVAIRPYKKKGITSCQYCGFSAVCQFDAAREENTYRLFYDREDEEVWRLLAEEDK